jgi:hypothetical protein
MSEDDSLHHALTVETKHRKKSKPLELRQCYKIARVRFPKPQDYEPQEIYFAIWPNPPGLTIRTAMYVFKDDGKKVDLKAGHDVLK